MNIDWRIPWFHAMINFWLPTYENRPDDEDEFDQVVRLMEGRE